MAAINDLIEQIENPELRQRIQQEINKQNKQRKFGLVFEDHVRENKFLYDVPVRRGSLVALRDKGSKETYRVIRIDGDNALCEHTVSHEQETIAMDVLVSVAQLGEPIYPYLKPMDDVQNAPNSELWHTLIEADNYHALQLLVYLYGGKVDCIYIDPPYNSGATDWKYNNNYVDGKDAYRHSKWLSMMEKRLLLAKKLLKSDGSVLILTIDEKEYLHIGCLLEQLFSEATIQMVTSVISGKGVSRNGQFSRVEEYIFFVTIGNMPVLQLEKTMLNDEDNSSSYAKPNAIDFLGFRRRNKGNFRTSRPHQFYPVIVNDETGQIVSIGDALTPDISRYDVEIPVGCTALWPLDKKKKKKIWSLIPESARVLLSKGCLKVENWDKERHTGSVKYLAAGMVEDIDNGVITIDKRDIYGNIVSGYYTNSDDDTLRPRRVWVDKLHNASSYGTLILKKVLGEKRFDFPKSLYAVHDSLRFFIANNPNALVVDFFAGSGTTLHAVNLLNAEDGGHRRCIMVTNNEIGDKKEEELKPIGLHPGKDEWEKWGIARYVNWPRSKCSILGVDVNGKELDGEYISTITETKQSSRRFNQINFFAENPSLKQKKALVALLNKQKNIKLPAISEDVDFLVAEDDEACNASILFNVAAIDDWKDALEGHDEITDLYIVTQQDALFRKAKAEVSELMGPIEESVPVTLPMKDGFKTNAAYFKLGFLDKTSVALGRQFKELLPILWMKSGARGVCPQLDSEELPQMLICEKNHFAVLIDENAYPAFEEQINKMDAIDTVFIITDSERGYREMANGLKVSITYQLYRDYLDNFRINNVD